MLSLDALHPIYQEHAGSRCQMAKTLLLAGTPVADVELLRRLPWPYLANRIAVERQRLSLPMYVPQVPWRVLPSAGFTPAQMVKLFELGLDHEGEDDFPDGQSLVLPA